MSMTYCGLDTAKHDPRIVCKNPQSRPGKVQCNWCNVSKCCSARGHQTCAECDDFVCELLLQFSVGPESDGGARVQVLTARRESRQ